LPHIAVLSVLGFVAVLLAIVDWFAALVLGRLPRWIAVYEIGVIAYSIHVTAYALLLADKFPPFAFSAIDYSVGVQIGPSQLSRVKVFFRWLLVIPAYVVTAIAGNGLLILSPIIWLVTLVLGRPPQSFFSAAAAVIRYQARYSAYMGLVTDTYPRRLFGDAASDWAPDGFRVLRTGRTELVTGVIVVLGIAAIIGNFVLQAELRPTSNRALVAAEARFETATTAYLSIGQCNSRPHVLRCADPYYRAWGNAFDRFASNLSSVSFPPSQRRQASAVVHDARTVGQALLVVSRRKTVAGYADAYRNFETLLHTFEADANSLLGHRL
jgi:Domain of unknown function (DUF4389)